MGALTAALGAAAMIFASAASAQHVHRWAIEIDAASARFGIPKSWIERVMNAESGGRTKHAGRPIVSRAGALGLMQLMPGTWREMRAKLHLGADPHDPADNIMAATLYLRLMYDRFGHPGLFAAYNAGPARYAAFAAGARPLPAETRAYVMAVARPMMMQRSAPAQAAVAAIFATNSANELQAEARRIRPPGRTLFVALSGSAPR